jgi:hypothetical protein
LGVALGIGLDRAFSGRARLGFKIVKRGRTTRPHFHYEICKAAFEKAIFVYPNDHLEMRQGTSVILRSKEKGNEWKKKN